MQEEPVTSGDQLRVIEEWVEAMKDVDTREDWSYGDIAVVQSVYEIIKDRGQ